MSESEAPATKSEPRTLSPAAQRALAEAEARRAEIDARAGEIRREREINGRGGLEPVRYDDWEVKGLATDF
ncbi:DUF1674 domain-containing protein [Methylobacterium currus]|uniref:DUF1674 domain-containing protein n=1 Tax=Methylobacterium currus TaxID=2051553 RepID=A0A2R4WFM4_9HYPH|nr:DUF1674 domain-containing protein [Methylobacterium currus]AWB20332.1 DUF1674 domain-containing protein [Methylobacterium currus]UHC14919.1 DUF1674 domain-containing protein [Methylobacterium currus]